MACDEIMTTIHSSMHEDDDDHHHHHQNVSRLSICTPNSSKHSMFDDDDDADDDDDDMSMFMSGLSIGISDGDADEELSENEKKGKGNSGESSDSDKEHQGCMSLVMTAPRRRNSRRRIMRERWLERAWERRKNMWRGLDEENYQSDESECLKGKGGSKCFCLDLEEVKGCKDLGFELEEEQERMLEIPSRLSRSCSTVDTSSGGNSPIANWRISSPGDDPRDVKARLKVWAQAVALVSASQLVS